MNETLEESQRDVSEAEMDFYIAEIVRFIQTCADHCLYVRIGARSRNSLMSIAASHGAEVKMLRPYGPWYLSWLAFLIPGHEALLKLKKPESLADLYEAELKDDNVSAIFGFERESESHFLKSCQSSDSLDLESDVFARDSKAFILEFVFNDTPPDAVRWAYKGCDVAINFE